MASIWTQADIDALKAKVASGVQSISFTGPSGRTIQYANLAEMRSLLAEMVASVGADAGTRPSFRLAASRKGV